NDYWAAPAAQEYEAGAYIKVLHAPTKTSWDVSDDNDTLKAQLVADDEFIVGIEDTFGNVRVIDKAGITFGSLVAGQNSVTMSYTVKNSDGDNVTLTGAITDLTIVAKSKGQIDMAKKAQGDFLSNHSTRALPADRSV